MILCMQPSSSQLCVEELSGNTLAGNTRRRNAHTCTPNLLEWHHPHPSHTYCQGKNGGCGLNINAARAAQIQAIGQLRVAPSKSYSC